MEVIKNYIIFLGGLVGGILRHSILVMLCSYLTALFTITVFGEFVKENFSALDEFLTFLVIFATIYVSFLWSKK